MSSLADTHAPLRYDIGDWENLPLFPQDLISLPEDSFLDRIYLTDFLFTDSESYAEVSWDEGELFSSELMGLAGISLTLGDDNVSQIAIQIGVSEDDIDFLLQGGFGLRFDTALIRAAEQVNGAYQAAADPVYGITLTTGLRIGTGSLSLEGTNAIIFDPFMIGDTGIAVDPGEVRLCFSAESATDLAAEFPNANLDAQFRGVFIPQGTLYFPESFPIESATIENAFIGNHGFTGDILVDMQDPNTAVSERGAFAGFAFSLDTAELNFVQNAITYAAISGTLTVPYFDAAVDVTIGIGLDGRYTAALASADGLFDLTQPQLGTLTLTSLGIETATDETAVILSGSLQLTAGEPGLQWPQIAVQEWRIDPGGQIQIPEGWIDLQEPVTLDLYGFALEITRIGLGNEADGRRWVGFSGALSLLAGLPARASADGLRIIWDPTGGQDVQIKLDGIGIELAVAGVLSLLGQVKLIDEPAEQYFLGHARLFLDQLGAGFDVAIKIGRDPILDYKYLYVFVGVDLPVGLPLFATGAAIYGISGLYGMNITPAIDDHDGDWYLWYRAAPRFDVTDPNKWEGEEDHLAFGAGLVVGTLFDKGWVLSLKSLLALLLPGPVVLIQGKANLLKLKPDLSSDQEGLFSALAVMDGRAGTLQLNVDAAWSVAKLIDIQAGSEAFFSFATPSAWHLYLGQKTPEDRRIRADIFALFHANGYLMIDKDGFVVGFGVSYGEEWKFGPVKVTLRSWLEAEAAVTWRPLQLTGSLGLGGEFAVSVALFSIGISAEATLSGKTPKPYHIVGTLHLTVNLPTPIKDLDQKIKLEWKQTAVPEIEDAFDSADVDHAKVTDTWSPMVNTLDLTPEDAGFGPGPVVPLDGRPNLHFNRSVRDNTGLDNANIQYAGGDEIGDYTFDYDLVSVTLQRWAKAGGDGWQAVDAADLFGAWTAVDDPQGEPGGSSLQVWAKSPFEFARHANRVYRDNYLLAAGWPCHHPGDGTYYCVDWEVEPLDTTYRDIFYNQNLMTSVLFIVDEPVQVIQSPPLSDLICGQDQCLNLTAGGQNRVWIGLPEPAQWVELCIWGKVEEIRAYGGGELLDEAGPFYYIGRIRPDATAVEWIEIVTGIGDPDVERLLLLSVCFETAAEVGQNAQETDFQERMEANLTHWGSEREILQPESYYRLVVETKTTRRSAAGTDAQTFTHYAYFQTAGPPAVTLDAQADVSADILNLAAYIRFHIPLLNQAAVYRAYNVGLEFNEDYLEQLYGADLRLRLVDNNDRPLLDEDGNEVLLLNQWGNLPYSELSFTEIDYVARLQECGQVEELGIGANTTYLAVSSVPGLTLAPNTRYTVQVLASTVLFHDPLPDGWADASWQLLTDGDVQFALIGEDDWADYQIDFTCDTDATRYGALVRYRQTGSAFEAVRLLINPSLERIRLAHISGTVDVAGGTFVIEQRELLWSCTGAACPVDLALATVSLSLLCQGDELTVAYSDVVLATVALPASLSTGKAGLYFDGTTSPNFSDVVIYSRPRQEIYRWPFTTSRYLNFVDHLASYDGQVWTEPGQTADQNAVTQALQAALDAMTAATQTVTEARAALAGCDEFSLAQCRLDAQGATAVLQETSAAQFDSLWALLLGSAYRPHPPHMEMTAVMSGGDVAALLLESPEPLLWERIHLTMEHTSKRGTTNPVPGQVVWNGDKTRAFVLVDPVFSFKTGTYTLTFVLEMDVGAEAAVLHHNGQNQPEVGQLSVLL